MIVPTPPLKPRDSAGRMNVGSPRSESDYVFAPLAVFSHSLGRLSLYPGDCRVLVIFADASKGILRREELR
jgi:hypothetical protein